MKARYRVLDHLERLAPAPGDREKALADARRIAAFLRETYGAETKGVGSLFLEGRPFTEKSDIDLVPYEDANSYLRKLADEEGVKL